MPVLTAPSPSRRAALERVLKDATAETDKLLASRRWQLGDRAGDAMAPWGRRRRGADDELRELSKSFRSYLASRDRYSVADACRLLDSQLAKVQVEVGKLLSSRRWMIGSLVGAAIGKGQEPTSVAALRTLFAELPQSDRVEATSAAATPAKPAGHRWGRSAADDASERQRAYERFIADVETRPARSANPPQVHAVIVVDWATARRVAPLLARTLRSSIGTVAAVTVVGPRAAAEAALAALGPVDVTVVDPSEDPTAAAAIAAGPRWVVLLAPGDELAVGFADGLAEAWVDRVPTDRDDLGAVVFDDDVRGSSGRRDVHFKPAMSPDWLLEHDYVGNGVAVDRDVIARLGGFADLSRSALRRLLLHAHDEGVAVGKVDRVLLHVAARPGRDVAADAAVTREALARRGVDPAAVVERPWGVRVSYTDPTVPLVSIVVPFRDRVDLLSGCVESVQRVTTYPNWQLVLVDNRSEEADTAAFLAEVTADPRVKVVTFDEEFNYSRINNVAAREHADGDVIVFVNSDVEVLSADWLEQLVGMTAQPGVGLVGAKLKFANGSIQHAGVAVGITGMAGHPYSGMHEPTLPPDELRHARNWLAVTGALVAVRRDAFDEIDGFDESFEITGSDVDLGLRMVAAGRRNVVLPDVEAYHYEKQTRAKIRVRPVDQERSLVAYQPYLSFGDPYYNRNLSRTETKGLARTRPEPGFAQLHLDLRGGPSARAGERKRDEVGFLSRYDATVSELDANAAVLEAMADDRTLPLGEVSWFLPVFDHVYRGGVYTILRIANHMTATRGTHHRIVLTGKTSADVSGLTAAIAEAWPELDFEVLLLPLGGSEMDLPPSDIGIATLWTTAYHLMRYNRCRGKFYLVQDFEPSFFAGGTVSGLIEQTYRFRFPGVANTLGVAAGYAAFGNDVLAFTPGVDRTVFRPDASAQPTDRTRIVFYGRPNNPRNAFELGIEALEEVKRRHGDAVEIISAGADFDVDALGLGGVIDNRGTLPTIDAVAQLYRSSHVGLVFMYSKHPSYQPLEYMASGCATVTNHNDANEWLYRDRDNVLLAPSTVLGVADRISELVRDRQLRDRVITGGLETVSGLDWPDELERIARFLETGQGGLTDA